MTQASNTPQQHPTFDTTVRPQDDFFRYVNANWIARHPIPKSETKWGTFMILREESWNAMRTIYEDTQATDPAAFSIKQQTRDFYYTGMHYDEFEAVHIQQVKELCDKIDAAEDTQQIAGVLGMLHAMDIKTLWYTYVDSDHDDSAKHVLHVCQSGLTLPDRDYYLDDTEKMRTIRAAYQLHTEKVYEFFPKLAQSATQLWDSLIAFETSMAAASRPSSDLRDVEKNYHKTALTTIKDTYPLIDWDAYATGMGWTADDKISLDQPEFVAFVHTSLETQSLDTIKAYLKWRTVSEFLGKISSRFSELEFEFFGKVLGGTAEIMPLWKRVVYQTEDALGEGAGRLYAEQYFPESSKQQVLTIVEQVRAAYAERIDQLDWLSKEHQAYAKTKLANLKVLIGYPDGWRDFSGLTVGRDSYIANIIAAQKYDVAHWLKRLHEPTSRDEWFMNPQTVNAYHDPNRLVICFPAGILQRPFFDPGATLAENMGGIGTVIGHELTHGFDDQGCMFDAEGNVRVWQSDEERAAFDKKAQIIVDQADAFEVLPGLNLRGRLVLGESIADLGGIEISLHALKKMLSESEDKTEAINQFFVNYAYTECGSVREEKLREVTLVDPHPLSEFRVNGILQHVDDFYEVLDVLEGDGLYLAEGNRARIW